MLPQQRQVRMDCAKCSEAFNQGNDPSACTCIPERLKQCTHLLLAPASLRGYSAAHTFWRDVEAHRLAFLGRGLGVHSRLGRIHGSSSTGSRSRLRLRYCSGVPPGIGLAQACTAVSESLPGHRAAGKFAMLRALRQQHIPKVVMQGYNACRTWHDKSILSLIT